MPSCLQLNFKTVIPTNVLVQNERHAGLPQAPTQIDIIAATDPLRVNPVRLSPRFRLVVPFLAVTAVTVFQPREVSPQSAPRLERLTVRADDGHLLAVWAKHPQHRGRGAILLLHGRTWSALPNFDLHAGGKSASLMDALVAKGYAVYALDQRGYGATPRDSSGWLTPNRAASDASEVLDWIRHRESGAHRVAPVPVLFGYARGSLTALLTAQSYPEHLCAVIVYGLGYKPKVYENLGVDPTTPRRARTTLAAAGTDFTVPGSPDPAIKLAYQRAAVAADSVRVDWRNEQEFAALDPRAIHVPVMLLNGELDPTVGNSADTEFFSHLTSVDRTWVVLAHSDHLAHLERPHDFVAAIVTFLGRINQ